MNGSKLLLLTVCGFLACCARVSPAAEEHDASAPAATHSSDSAHGEEAPQEGAIDPLGFDPDLAIFSVIVFVLLLVVLKKFAWGPIIQGLERREQNIAEHIAETQRSHEAAKALLADYEKKLASAAGEVRELLEEARRDAEHAKQAILAEAKAGADVERARALHDIEEATNQALTTLAQRSAELAIELAGKVLQSKLSPADHQRLIAEAMARFPEATPSTN